MPVAPANDKAALNAVVSGRVQGVYFRAFVKRLAREFILTGFVRNMADGTVQVHAEGDKNRLEELLGNLKQGPPAARVDRVEVSWLEPTGQYVEFSVTG